MPRAVPVVLLCAALAAPAARADEGTVDVSSVRARLRLFGDGKGHYLAAVTERKLGEAERWLFYGDGKTFRRQRLVGSTFDDSGWFSLEFWEPRVTETMGFFLQQRDSKEVQVHCGKRVTTVTRVPAEEEQKLLDAAKFLPHLWKRKAYALARDDTGRYYFVDRAREPEDNLDFRLYVGPRGSMKLTKLKNVVSDSMGDIFATRKGELRLVVGNGEATWIVGRRRTALTFLDLGSHRTAHMVYKDLGVYYGEPLGTPCDDL